MPVTIASPAAMPKVPPWKAKSWTATVTLSPSSVPKARVIASAAPVLVRFSFRRSEYRLTSRNFSGSDSASGVAISS